MDNNTVTPVTLEDVRRALAEMGVSASATNAAAVRRTIGRGGLGTIQKHLVALRAEASRAATSDRDAEVPPVPDGLADGIWALAVAQARAMMGEALAAALAAKAEAEEALAAARADAEAVYQAVDEADQRVAEMEAAAAAAEAAKAAAEQRVDELEHAVALERARHEAAVAALEAQVDRLTSQLADYRAMLGANGSERVS